MKLNTIHMVGIIVASLLFAYLLKLEINEGFGNPPPDYTALMTVHKQIETLKEVGTTLDAITVKDMDYTEKAKIKERIDIVEKQLQTWINDRVIYLNKNNVITAEPIEKETIAGLKILWVGKDGQGGSNVLITSTIPKLDPVDVKQEYLIKLMKAIANNMNDVVL